MGGEQSNKVNEINLDPPLYQNEPNVKSPPVEAIKKPEPSPQKPQDVPKSVISTKSEKVEQ